MSRNTQASLITLALMCAGALAYDHFLLSFPAMTILFVVLFGPISFLLWRKENLRDYGSKALVKYCGKAILASIGIGAVLAAMVFVQGLMPGEERATPAGLWGAFLIFLVAAGLIPVFILLSLLRLGIRHILDSLFGSPRTDDTSLERRV